MDPALASESDFRGWIGEGDLRRAGEWLVLRYADEVLGLCGAMVRDRQAAEDLAQDVFSRAFAALAAFRGEASTRTWLLQIARNRCIDHLRARNKQPWGPGDGEDEPDGHPDDAPLPHDLILRRTDVEDALSQLAEGERALVVLRFKNGLEYGELAEAFGLREGTVRMRLSRALAKMREALRDREATPTAASFALDADVDGAAAPASRAAPAPPAPMAARAPQRARPPAMGGAPTGAPPPPPQAAPPAGAPSARTASTRAGMAKPGFLQRLMSAFRGGSGVPPRRMPPDHPLSRYFLATLDARDDRVVDELLDKARSLHQP